MNALEVIAAEKLYMQLREIQTDVAEENVKRWEHQQPFTKERIAKAIKTLNALLEHGAIKQ